MDPLSFFPPEVCDSILQYLTGNELLEASRVSKTWYSIIGESSKIMQKIQLNLFWLRGPHRLTNEMENILIVSHRKYQNVVMKFQSLHIDEFKNILQSNKCQWKSVKIERIVFNSATDLMDMIEIFKNTVVEFDMSDVYIKCVNNLTSLKFPKLKVLKLNNVEVNDGIVNEIFKECQNLEVFQMTSHNSSKEFVDSVKCMLKRNHKLKHIEMTSQILSSIFNDDISFKFKLDTFISSNYCNLKCNVDYVKFLQNQFEYIETISFDEMSCLDTLKLIFQMPKLKSLNLGNVDSSVMHLSDINLNVNKAIEKLSYRDLEKQFNIMKSLLDAMPNVKDVEMFSMTQDMMEYMSSAAKNLKALKLRTLNAINLSSNQLFPNLKEVYVDILSPDLETNILAIPVDEANPLVKLLKVSNYIILH